jgi:heterodisulfide reductase subunit D
MKKNKPFGRELTKVQRVELDACTQCGECLKHCPVQQVTGKPQISPPEKIRLFRKLINETDSIKSKIFGEADIDPQILQDLTNALYECTVCGACGQSCPVGLFNQRLWPVLRKEMVNRGLGPIGPQANMPKVVKETGNPYNEPAEKRYSPWFPENVQVAEKSELAYYAGCTGAYLAHPMVRGDVLVLNKIGEPFTMLPPEDEVCCGFPLFITGQHDMMKELTDRLVNAYQERGVKTLICSCPCCVNIMARDWPIYYGKELPFKIRHITQFVNDSLKSGKLKFKKDMKERLIYHDPCYLSRGVGIIEEPRSILKHIPGVELLEFDRHGADSRCCGSGGAARKVFSENAIAMGRLTIDEAVEKKADKLILSCPACYDKVNEALEGHDKQIKIIDIMELVAALI